jgi:hypothetical protein
LGTLLGTLFLVTLHENLAWKPLLGILLEKETGTFTMAEDPKLTLLGNYRNLYNVTLGTLRTFTWKPWALWGNLERTFTI